MRWRNLSRNSCQFNLAASRTGALRAARSKNYQFVGLGILSPHVRVLESSCQNLLEIHSFPNEPWSAMAENSEHIKTIKSIAMKTSIRSETHRSEEHTSA